MIDQKIIVPKAALASIFTGALAIVVFAGCSGSGPSRYGFAGVVKYEGKDAAVADIVFSPDSDKGTKGPGAFVKAKDGKFKVDAEHGPVKGTYLVDVTIYDGKSTSAKDSLGKKVAGPLQKKIEIPPAKNLLELNFAAGDPADVPVVKPSEATRRRS